MPRKRDGFISFGDVAETVELPSGHALTRGAPKALRASSACLRSGPTGDTARPLRIQRALMA